MAIPFQDRRDAGRQLAKKLQGLDRSTGTIVLGLPRGGVPVAFEVATALGLPMDIFLVRKLGVPGHEELAMGAIASGGIRVLNFDVIDLLNIPAGAIEAVEASERRELARRERLYRGSLPAPAVTGRTVILVDDGLATGSTMRAAVAALKAQKAARVIVAVPVASSSACRSLEPDADQVVCAHTPEPFQAVGIWYEDFSPTSDQEVRELLSRAREREEARAGTDPGGDESGNW